VDRTGPLGGCRRVLGNLLREFAGCRAGERQQPKPRCRTTAEHVIDERNDRCGFASSRACQHARMATDLVLKDALLLARRTKVCHRCGYCNATATGAGGGACGLTVECE